MSWFASWFAQNAAKDDEAAADGGLDAEDSIRRVTPHKNKLTKNYGDTVVCVAFSHDQEVFLVAGQRGEVKIYRTAGGDELHSHQLTPKVGISAMLVLGESSSDLIVIFGTFKGELHSFRWSMDATTPAPAREVVIELPSNAPSHGAHAMSRFRTRKVVHQATVKKTIGLVGTKLEELAFGPPRTMPFQWNELVSCTTETLAFSQKHSLVFAGGKTESIYGYKLTTATGGALNYAKVQTPISVKGKVMSMSCGWHGEMLAVGGEMLTIELYRVSTCTWLSSVATAVATQCLSFSTDGSKLAIGTAATVSLCNVIWDPSLSERPYITEDFSVPQGVTMGQVSFSNDGSQLAIAGEIGFNRVVSVVSTTTGATMRKMRFQERVRCCALDLTGRRLLVGTFGRVAELYYQGLGTTMKHFACADDTVRCVYLAAPLKLLAVAGDAIGKGSCVVYDTDNASQNRNAPLFRIARESPIWSVNISPDGSWLTMGGYDSTIAVYDLNELVAAARARTSTLDIEPVQEINYKPAKNPLGFIWSSHFCKASTTFVVGSWNGYAYVYDVASPAEAQKTKKISPPRGGATAELEPPRESGRMRVLSERGRIHFCGGSRVYGVHVSDDGNRVVVGGRSLSVVMYDCSSRALPPSPVWTAEGRDFTYTVALTDTFCAFAGTGRVVQVVSSTTGDSLFKFSVSGTVQSICMFRHFLAVSVVEAGTAAVYNLQTAAELICLPSVFGAVNYVTLDDDALCIASGHQASMYGGCGDFSWQQVPDYYVAAALIHGEQQMSLRCLGSILRESPDIVNCQHPERGHTFLQYATQNVDDPLVMRLLLEGNNDTKLALEYDVHGETAFTTALAFGKRLWVKMLVNAVLAGRVMSLPSALDPVVQNFPILAREHPNEFIKLIVGMPLTLQNHGCWPYVIEPLTKISTYGSASPIITPHEGRHVIPQRRSMSLRVVDAAHVLARWIRLAAPDAVSVTGRHSDSSSAAPSMAEEKRGGDVEKMRLYLFGGENASSLGDHGPSRGSYRRRKTVPTGDSLSAVVRSAMGTSPSANRGSLVPETSSSRCGVVDRLASRMRTASRGEGASPAAAADAGTDSAAECATTHLSTMITIEPMRSTTDIEAEFARAEASNITPRPVPPYGVRQRMSRVFKRGGDSTNTSAASSLGARLTRASAKSRMTKGWTKATEEQQHEKITGSGPPARLSQAPTPTKRLTRRPGDDARRRTQVKVWTVPWRNWASQVDHEGTTVDDSPLALLIEAVKATNDRSGYESMAVKALITWKWAAFARNMYYSMLTAYLIGVVATALQAVATIRILTVRHGYAAGRGKELETFWYQLHEDGPARTSSILPDTCMPNSPWPTVTSVWDMMHHCTRLGIAGRELFVVLYAITSARGVIFLGLEIMQMHSEVLAEYFTDFWNVFDIVNSILPLAVNALILVPATWDPDNATTWGYALQSLLAASCFMCGFKLLWFIRVFPSLGPLVTMFFEILRIDLLPFLVLLMILIFSVAMSLHVLQGPVDNEYADPIRALFSTWGVSLYVRGERYDRSFGLLQYYQRSHYKEDQLDFGYDNGFPLIVSPQLVLYELLMIMVQIVLLNLLIAIMSDTYARERERIRLTSSHLKALIIWEYEQLFAAVVAQLRWIPCLPRSWRTGGLTNSSRFPEWLHFCQPESHASKGSSGGGGGVGGSGNEDEDGDPTTDNGESGKPFYQRGNWIETLQVREEERFRDLTTKILTLKANVMSMKSESHQMSEDVSALKKRFL